MTPATVKRLSPDLCWARRDFNIEDLNRVLDKALQLRKVTFTPEAPVSGLLSLKGLFFVLVWFDDDEARRDWHFIGVDTWRGVVWDDSEEYHVPLKTRKLRVLLDVLGYGGVVKVWQVFVNVKHLVEFGHV